MLPDEWPVRVANALIPRQPSTPLSPGGEIGRHKGLKIPRRQLRAGSSPAPGTIFCHINHEIMGKYDIIGASTPFPQAHWESIGKGLV